VYIGYPKNRYYDNGKSTNKDNYNSRKNESTRSVGASANPENKL